MVERVQNHGNLHEINPKTIAERRRYNHVNIKSKGSSYTVLSKEKETLIVFRNHTMQLFVCTARIHPCFTSSPLNCWLHYHRINHFPTLKTENKPLKTTEQQIRKMIQNGELPAVKVGREFRIPFESVVAFIDGNLL